MVKKSGLKYIIINLFFIKNGKEPPMIILERYILNTT